MNAKKMRVRGGGGQDVIFFSFACCFFFFGLKVAVWRKRGGEISKLKFQYKVFYFSGQKAKNKNIGEGNDLIFFSLFIFIFCPNETGGERCDNPPVKYIIGQQVVLWAISIISLYNTVQLMRL